MFPLGGPAATLGAGSSLNAAGGSAGPSSARGAFDSSDWTVATGGSRAGGFDLQTLAIVGGIALLALVLWKKL